MTTTWTDIAAVLEARGGKLRLRSGNQRAWRVPHPTGGTFQVEVTLRPRWCSLSVDRWYTTSREKDLAGPWFETHVWPFVNEALRRHDGFGCLPSGGPTFTAASPLQRGDLLEVLEPWIDAELAWGVPRDEPRTNPGRMDERPMLTTEAT